MVFQSVGARTEMRVGKPSCVLLVGGPGVPWWFHPQLPLSLILELNEWSILIEGMKYFRLGLIWVEEV